MWVVVAKIACALFNAFYQLCCLVCRRRNLVLMMSRQGNQPPRDFLLLREEFEARGWEVRLLVGVFDRAHAVPFAWRCVRKIPLVAQCKLIFLDGADPVLSLLDLKCEPVAPKQAAEWAAAGLHTEFPAEPVVVQIWHALGAFKKFGYQSVGTKEGRNATLAAAFKMHRNYSWILVSGEGARAAMSESFACPVERILPLGRAEGDVLLAQAAAAQAEAGAAGEKPRVLFAPTLRRRNRSQAPFRLLHAGGQWHQLEDVAQVQWAFHPVEDVQSSASASFEAILQSQILVTDYSSLVYEAYMVNKQVLFYVPDLERYLKSPGVNPSFEGCDGIVFKDYEQMFEAIRRFVADPSSYPYEQLEKFAGAACPRKPGAVGRIVDAAEGWAAAIN